MYYLSIEKSGPPNKIQVKLKPIEQCNIKRNRRDLISQFQQIVRVKIPFNFCWQFKRTVKCNVANRKQLFGHFFADIRGFVPWFYSTYSTENFKILKFVIDGQCSVSWPSGILLIQTLKVPIYRLPLHFDWTYYSVFPCDGQPFRIYKCNSWTFSKHRLILWSILTLKWNRFKSTNSKSQMNRFLGLKHTLKGKKMHWNIIFTVRITIALNQEFFTISPQYMNVIIANFVLAVLFKMGLTNKVCNLET